VTAQIRPLSPARARPTDRRRRPSASVPIIPAAAADVVAVHVVATAVVAVIGRARRRRADGRGADAIAAIAVTAHGADTCAAPIGHGSAPIGAAAVGAATIGHGAAPVYAAAHGGPATAVACAAAASGVGRVDGDRRGDQERAGEDREGFLKHGLLLALGLLW